jgi:hypothetical protein
MHSKGGGVTGDPKTSLKINMGLIHLDVRVTSDFMGSHVLTCRKQQILLILFCSSLWISLRLKKQYKFLDWYEFMLNKCQPIILMFSWTSALYNRFRYHLTLACLLAIDIIMPLRVATWTLSFLITSELASFLLLFSCASYQQHHWAPYSLPNNPVLHAGSLYGLQFNVNSPDDIGGEKFFSRFLKYWEFTGSALSSRQCFAQPCKASISSRVDYFNLLLVAFQIVC